MSKYIKDKRVKDGAVIEVSDAVAEMVLKDPDIVEVSGPEEHKPAKRVKSE